MGTRWLTRTRLGLGWVRERRTLPTTCLFFFSKGFIPSHPIAEGMPSKFVVGLSLDSELMDVWNSLPIGERSKRVREALRTAEIVEVKDTQIKSLEKQIDINVRTIRKLQLEITNLEAFGVKQ